MDLKYAIIIKGYSRNGVCNIFKWLWTCFSIDLKTLYLVRHGQTDANLNKVVQGQTDTPLNETGLIQARKVAEKLKSVHADMVLSSDLSRAAQTAEVIAKTCGLPMKLTKDLREMSLGVWEGKRFEEIAQTPLSKIWFVKPSRLILEGAESVKEVQERVVAAIFDTLKDHKTLIVVSHGLAIALFILYVKKLPLDSMWDYLPDNTFVSKVIVTEELTSVVQNDF